MNNWKSTFFIIALIVIVNACKKDKPGITAEDQSQEDTIIKKDVKGLVFNLCTDKGLGGIKVYLEIYKEKTLIFKTSQVSDDEGYFIFPEIELHSAALYHHYLYIPSKSGISAKDKETCGIKGGSLGFTIKDADELLTPRVIPSFIYLAFYFPREYTTVASDSIIARCEQRTYHKNVPDYPYKFGDGAIGIEKGTYPKRIGNYPMGLYHIVVDKWVGGVHTQWKDSVYTHYGDSAKYVVRW